MLTKTPTSIEKIKAYHSIKGFLTEEQQKEVIAMLGLNSTDLEKRVWGKDNEVEFILMIHLLEWCKSIIGFEEGVAKLTNTVASDLLIELVNGDRVIVEIKSTEKNKYSISANNFNEKRIFANKMGAKLYFAVKMAGYWTLFSSEYLEKKGRKISLDDDFINSELNGIFGDRSFLFPKGLKISSIYSKSDNKHLGLYNSDFGHLVSYKIEFLNRKIIKINSNQHEKYHYIFLFENLQDTMSIQKQNIQNIDSDRTVITEELTEEMTQMNLSAFILSPIRHTMSDLGHVFDFSQYLTNLIDGTKQMITRQHILYAISFLCDRGYPVYENRENNLYNFRDMRIK
ncbi:hypothetical protein ASD24_28605 [Paenibacillus sp. Root52]|uniref:hypothetical protein n=1 Tax=Paenibacillus sp. Root52 TaxID=1736552 RepID=UPI0007012A46|nr:hypothetical protein [Paenibacillus sp. Root52]KQY85245.1 hypothetical protein ASD24_28605 [Paenibacillus sp. Root52]